VQSVGLQNDAHCGWIVSPVRSGEARHGLVMTDGAFVGADAFDGNFDGNGALDGALDADGALDGLGLDVEDSTTNAPITNAPSTRWRLRTILRCECELGRARAPSRSSYTTRSSSQRLRMWSTRTGDPEEDHRDEDAPYQGHALKATGRG
jgi:hypothetical protein